MSVSFRESNFAHCLMKYAFLTACGQHTRSVMRSIIRESSARIMAHTGWKYMIWDFPIRRGQMCFTMSVLKLMQVM